jgi:hypothetical protein
MIDLPPPTRITPQEMRKLFNDNGFLEKVKRGELIESVRADRHPSLPLANEPWCTRSQEISYIEVSSNEEVARVHRYLRTDGSIGLSGRPDPKRLSLNGVRYRLETKPK